MSRHSLKRDILLATGVLEYLWKKITPCQYVFSYHPVVNPDDTPFNPDTRSCDEVHFAKQMAAIYARFASVVLSARNLPVTTSAGERDNKLMGVRTHMIVLWSSE
jgi:hypothetical protein